MSNDDKQTAEFKAQIDDLKRRLVEVYREKDQEYMLKDTEWYEDYVSQEKKDKE